MAIALISVLTKRLVQREVSMTGEITLRGNVLPIGGVKEKVLAAHRAGLKKVILPAENEKDMEIIPKHVRKDVDIVFVEHMDEVIDIALKEDTKPKVAKKGKKVTTKKLNRVSAKN